jgi:hypothetical protein
MLTFATEFPVDHAHDASDFLEVVRAWLLGLPNSGFQPSDLEGLTAADDWTANGSGGLVRALRVAAVDDDCAAVGYKPLGGEPPWALSIGFSRQTEDSWVSVRVATESGRLAVPLPCANRPGVVGALLDQLGGAADGLLAVQATPCLLTGDDLELASLCLTGQAGCRLPVVYVSAEYQGHHAVDVDALAEILYGLAHVLVEPDRSYSFLIKDATNSANTFGGTIGLYWPDGRGRRTFFRGPSYPTAADLGAAVCEEVCAVLLARRPLARCTWAAVQHAYSRRALDQLRRAGSSEIDLYVAEFDRELRAKERQLADAEQEIVHLREALRECAVSGPVAGGLVLHTGPEQDFYPGEMATFIGDALVDAVDRTVRDSRRRHVLSAVAAANPPGGEARERREQLKTLLRDYRRLDAKTERGLRDLGFDIEQDGKHYKLTYQGDERYVMPLPKSGSDHRGGLNAAADIARLLF